MSAATKPSAGSVTLRKRIARAQDLLGLGPLQHAGQTGGADPPAVLVGDDDLVRGHLSAQMKWGRDPGDPARSDSAMVGRGDLDSDRVAAERFPGVQRGADRADRLGED